MVSKQMIMNQISNLPPCRFEELSDYIDLLKIKESREHDEAMLISEQVLSKYWDTKEEDEAWADL